MRAVNRTRFPAAERRNVYSSLREMLLSFAGVIEDADLPSDLAENLDHYLYGTPKRQERAK